MDERPADVAPEQPPEDWAEQRTDVDPDAADREADAVTPAADTMEADHADVAEQAAALGDDEPYPHD